MRVVNENELKQTRFPVDEHYNIEHGVSAITAYKLGWNDAINFVIKTAQTIDAVPVARGVWRITPTGRVCCSVCGSETNAGTLYCPWCGADMKGKENG